MWILPSLEILSGFSGDGDFLWFLPSLEILSGFSGDGSLIWILSSHGNSIWISG